MVYRSKPSAIINKPEMTDEARKLYIDAMQKPNASQSKPNELTVKIGADCSDVLKAMKALRREAKETIHALNELNKAGLPVTDVQRLIMHPDDVLIVSTNCGLLSKDIKEKIEDKFNSFFPQNKIVVLDAGWNIIAAGVEVADKQLDYESR